MNLTEIEIELLNKIERMHNLDDAISFIEDIETYCWDSQCLNGDIGRYILEKWVTKVYNIGK